MILCDVNVLIHAFRADSIEHARYHGWLEGVVNGDSAFGVSPQVLAAVARVTTHPRIYKHPSKLDDVMAFARALHDGPLATIVTPGERHWSIFEALCLKSKAMGNLVQDAWFAALAIEAGCEWITCDRDYSRFAGLRWRVPFAHT